jgi:dolichyl-phosphate-mannose--protein O-mannosyl transferase
VKLRDNNQEESFNREKFSMYVLPTWIFWFFLIAGFATIGYSFFPKENRSAAITFLIGFICVGIAVFLWLWPRVLLE